ncbi:XrtA/PEP-CTERM system TPR-repeat protein PrsT [Burkholderia sp. LMU1-1-1.1]|uniref:XrtA/PEP-CTERM system TPR-repeat protein PrsT n=1 Tax=Burkholderia sp. LMU1-1-1.1 TaxID=3135266 RepID=UPI003437D635
MARTKSGAASATRLIGGLSMVLLLGACGQRQTPDELIADAGRLQAKGDHRAAIIQLKNALEGKPKDRNARFLLAQASLDIGDASSAEKEALRAIELGYDPAAAYVVLAASLINQGRYADALARTGSAPDAGNLELMVLRAQAQFSLGKPELARQGYRDALAKNPAYAPALVGMAVLAVNDKDSQGAAVLIDQAIKSDARNAEAWRFKGEMLRYEGKWDEADACFDKVLAIKPDDRAAYLQKATLAIAARKFELAGQHLQAARKLAPGNVMVTYTQALLDVSQGKNEAARTSLLEVLKLAPEHLPSILLAGVVEYNLDSTQQAERYLRKYVESNPNNSYANSMLAATLLREKQPAEAMRVLRDTLKEGQAGPQLLALAGKSAIATGDYDKASEYLRQATKLAPDQAVLRTSLGLSEMLGGAEVSGLANLEAATALDAKSVVATTALVRAELDLKHYDKALAAAARLVKVQPDDADAVLLLALAQHGKDDRAAARASYERALALRPGHLDVVRGLVRLDLQEGRDDAAEQRLKKLAKDKGPVAVEAMSMLAELAVRRGRPAEATGWLEQAHAAAPDALEPALRLALQYLGVDQGAKALTMARKLQAANADNPSLLDVLGQAQLVQDEPLAALDTFSKLAALAPKSGLVQFRIATTYLRLKDEAKATAALQKALALQPDLLAAQLALIDMAQRSGKPEQGIAMARQIQKAHPQDPVGFVLEGDLLLARKLPDQARARYESADALAPKQAVKIKIVNAMRLAGKRKEGDDRLRAWLAQYPEATYLFMYAAELRLQEERYPEAATLLESVLKREPSNVGALNNLAWAYLQTRDGRALQTAERAYKLDEGNPQTADTLGWTLLELGQVERAVPLLRKAATLAPEVGDIRYHLAVAYFKHGNKVDARKELEQLIAKKQPFTHSGAAQDLLQQL